VSRIAQLWTRRAAPVAAEPARGPGQHRVEGYLERGDARLYYCHWEPDGVDAALLARGCLVVIMHGYGEHCRRYDELASFLLSRGHAVSRFDARGHGRSSGQRGHVAGYAQYVADLAAFVAHACARQPKRRLFLLGHSNGGLIVIRALQQGLLGVAGVILSSPLLNLPPRSKPLPDWAARLLSAGVPRLPLPSGIRASDLTHDQGLLEAMQSDRWLHRQATPRWYWSMLKAGQSALEEAHRVTVPVLTLQGELDSMIDCDAVAQLHAGMLAVDKQLVVRRGEYHEVLNELDREALFTLLANWLERVQASQGVA
jgi:alpha-beta hydrolase superfamily lysophospholipase